jgi:hypothetical protein
VARKIQVEVFCVVTPFSVVVVGYQRFEEPCIFHLQGEVTGAGTGICCFVHLLSDNEGFSRHVVPSVTGLSLVVMTKTGVY